MPSNVSTRGVCHQVTDAARHPFPLIRRPISASGTKRTDAMSLTMSASDPKRTFA